MILFNVVVVVDAVVTKFIYIYILSLKFLLLLALRRGQSRRGQFALYNRMLARLRNALGRRNAMTDLVVVQQTGRICV